MLPIPRAASAAANGNGRRCYIRRMGRYNNPEELGNRLGWKLLGCALAAGLAWLIQTCQQLP